jgi:hypothetical protein
MRLFRFETGHAAWTLPGIWGVVEGERDYSRIGSPRRGKVDRI